MDDVARLAQSGAEEGIVVVADEQTAGRGRAGRSWHAPPGTALLCSILLRPAVTPDRLSVLPLLAGVAVAEAIEARAPVECRLKWPNDLWIQERKVGGVLMTARTKEAVDYVVLGIGVNLVGHPDDMPTGATSIQAEADVTVTPRKLLLTLLATLQSRYDGYLRSHGVFDVRPWKERAALIGERVTIADRDEVITGIFVGVDVDGALLLDIESGMRRVVAGDMSRGPVRTR
jgi:BirA family transcriptional regulator, biotin operon repressor / biotin---[acetyl-CoA-carboxylase] ligase